jgi:hypothetical protein
MQGNETLKGLLGVVDATLQGYNGYSSAGKLP